MAAERISDNEGTRIALLEQSNHYLYELIQRIDKQFDKIDAKIGYMDDKVEREVKAVAARSWVQFTFLFGMISTVLAILARAEGWL